jgi:ribosomal protein RSM22 (predicted rRNA methylase)
MMHRVADKLMSEVAGYLLMHYLPERQRRMKGSTGFSGRDIEFFAKGAGELSIAFTRERGSLPLNYLNAPKYRSGYILYFTVTNYLKALHCLSEAGWVHGGKRIKVLDIGTGPGTALLAAADFFEGADISLTGIDQNRPILKDARALLRTHMGSDVGLNLISAFITHKNLRHVLGHGRYDIIFLSNILSELKDEVEAGRMIGALLSDHLAPAGRLIVIEPALQRTSRSLMTVRDILLGFEIPLRIVAPCLHENACPMRIMGRRDWCHMYLDWERPAIIEKIDRLVGNRKDYLKFSYLIAANDWRREGNDAHWRVVSAPLQSKGKVELLVCNRRGLIRLSRLDKDRSGENAVFDRLQRGDLIEYRGPERLVKGSTIFKR